MGKLVNPREKVDMLLVLSWKFAADGSLCGVDFHISGAEEFALT
jgi:hypothetical protein